MADADETLKTYVDMKDTHRFMIEQIKKTERYMKRLRPKVRGKKNRVEYEGLKRHLGFQKRKLRRFERKLAKWDEMFRLEKA